MAWSLASSSSAEGFLAKEAVLSVHVDFDVEFLEVFEPASLVHQGIDDPFGIVAVQCVTRMKVPLR